MRPTSRPRSRAIIRPAASAGAAARARGRSRPRARRRRGSASGSTLERQDRLHHPLHLRLLGAPVAAHRLLHARGRVLDARRRRRPRRRRARRRAPDRRRARCGRRRRRTTPRSRRRPGSCSAMSACTPSKIVLRRSSGRSRAGVSPPPVAECPDAASAFLDDPVPASSRPRVDAQNLHEERLGTPSDVPAFAGANRT